MKNLTLAVAFLIPACAVAAPIAIDMTSAKTEISKDSMWVRSVDVPGYGKYDINLQWNPETLKFDLVQAAKAITPTVSRTCRVSSKTFWGVVDGVLNLSNDRGYLNIEYQLTQVTNSGDISSAFVFVQGSRSFEISSWESPSQRMASLKGRDGFSVGQTVVKGSTVVFDIYNIPSWFDPAAPFSVMYLSDAPVACV